MPPTSLSQLKRLPWLIVSKTTKVKKTKAKDALGGTDFESDMNVCISNCFLCSMCILGRGEAFSRFLVTIIAERQLSRKARHLELLSWVRCL